MNRLARYIMALTAAVAAAIPVIAQQPEVELVDTIASSRITTDRLADRNSTQTGLEHLEGERLWRGFALFSSPDIIKSLQALPGVSSGSELASGLFVHGGDGADNLFLLDGVPMYQVSHLAGLFSSFNSDIVKSVDFYKSGFPGRYGGRLSSVVDVCTKDGDFQKYSGTFSMGLIDGRLQFGGPIVRNKLSFNAAIRRSWLDVITAPTFAIANAVNKKNSDTKSNAHYAFYDANASLTWLATTRSHLAARFYIGSDDIKLKQQVTRENSSMDSSYDLYTKIKIRWGNILGSVAWDTQFNSSLKLTAILYYSQNTSLADFEIKDLDYTNGRATSTTKDANSAAIRELGSKVDITWSPHKSHILRMGAKYSWTQYNPIHTQSAIVSRSGQALSSRSLTNGTVYNTHEIALYAEDEMTLAPWLKANAGLRYSPVFTGKKTWHMIEPRATLNFICADLLSIKTSYVRMHQVPHLVATTYIDLPANCWMPSTEKIMPSRSDQVAAGLYFTLPLNFDLNIEGYYKTMENLLEYCGNSGSLYPPLDTWETDFEIGRGRAFGMETELTWRSDKTEVNLYYTLSWSQRNFPSIYGGWFLDHYDNRHKLTIMANHRFSKKFDIYAAWNFHSGNRLTAAFYSLEDTYWEEYYEKPNNLALPAYHRLDVGMNIRKTTKRGRESIWNISIYNVYCNMNPIVGFVDLDKDDNYVLVTYGLVPIIPTFSYTLKF